MFEKIGLIALPVSRPQWMHSHAYIPNAFVLDADTIRIVVAFWDEKKMGRVGYIDVSAQNPLQIKGFSDKPSLDLGEPGAFDDNGVSPLSIVAYKNKLRLYYAGWQLSDKVRYFIFTGLAESKDKGTTFTRVKRTPVLERSDDELIIRAGAFVFLDSGRWKMLYAAGSKTTRVRDNSVPTYDLKLLESEDGVHWPERGVTVMAPDLLRGEFGFGRPYVFKNGRLWKMWYGIRTKEIAYAIGYSESEDGRGWVRKDEQMAAFNNSQWSHDNEMRTFPSLVTIQGKTYMFYNGNDYGKDGICLAALKA